MRSFNPLLVLILSFVSFVVSGPLHSTTHPSRFAKNPISSRQFHYPRALIDVCANIDLSVTLNDVLGLNLGSVLGDICLCLSAFPLNLDLYTDLQLLVNVLGETKLEALLKTLVEDNGTQCTHPDHASPKCTPGNACDFTCKDGFVKKGGACDCPLPNSVCNGKCGSYPHGCSSALPKAPKMTRRSITSSRNGGSPSPHSGGLLNIDTNVNFNLGGLLSELLGSRETTPGGSGNDLNIDVLVNALLNSLGISVPIYGGNQSSGLEADLSICVGAGISGTQSLLDTITNVVNSLLSSLLGTTFTCKVDSSCSVPADPNTISIGLQVCGLSSDSLESTLDKTLKAATNLLNGLLDGVKIATDSNIGGPGCPATPTFSSSGLPLPSPSTLPHPSVLPLSSSIGLLGQVEGILGDLGLASGDYNLNTDTDLIVVVSVGPNDTLITLDGLVAKVITLVDEVLDVLLDTDITVQINSNPTTSPTPPNPGQENGIVVGIDLGVVLNATLSDTGALVDGVLLAESEVLAKLLNLDVVVNVDGGHSCQCSGSRKASAKK
ncbi:hypothetical protein BDM02DRAFT_3183394 [Thelephora ganbajun]|uniref:Uncharacterized protein n=1 Tax=Thelephora ganbajun TaxID=370292 RepID=A0ACB6ZSX1_THEGA|nr:hypothetical protein BDM02DRAFT_3183394 [Thelephora ganbajun]